MHEFTQSSVRATYIVIEDEQDVRELLIDMVSRYCPDLSLIGQADSLLSAKVLLADIQPDIVFADINLGDGNIFSLFNEIQPFSYQVIFTTAYDQYALEAFEMNAVHYLLKPFGPDKLVNAVNRTEKGSRSSEELISMIRKSGLLDKTASSETLSFSTSDGIEVVQISKIIRIKADGSYSTISLDTGENIVVSKSIGEVASKLPSENFIRVHTSHLVNLDFISRYNKADGGVIEMNDGSLVPVSRRRKKELLDMLLRNS